LSSHSFKIEIADEQAKPFDSEPLISAVQQILADHGILQAEISLAIVDDPSIRQINKQYLDHDFETDVISFVLEYDQDAAALIGQLVVSTDTAHTMAGNYGGSMQDELLLYVVHGTLHLVGYDDKQQSDASDMRDAEKRYLASFGIEHRWDREEPRSSSPGNEPGPDEREVRS
jgi:probable rRNA maturation factor